MSASKISIVSPSQRVVDLAMREAINYKSEIERLQAQVAELERQLAVSLSDDQVSLQRLARIIKEVVVIITVVADGATVHEDIYGGEYCTLCCMHRDGSHENSCIVTRARCVLEALKGFGL